MKPLKIVGICIGVFVTTYLSAAFIGMEPNPKNWHEAARVAYIGASIVFSGCFIGILSDSDTI